MVSVNALNEMPMLSFAKRVGHDRGWMALFGTVFCYGLFLFGSSLCVLGALWFGILPGKENRQVCTQSDPIADWQCVSWFLWQRCGGRSNGDAR